MTSNGPAESRELSDLLNQYAKWRRIFAHSSYPLPNEPVWDSGRLHFRNDYPHEGWTSYIIEPRDGGYNVLRATTERRCEPFEGVVGFFSKVGDAGKYIIWNLAESFRMAKHLDPIEWTWDAQGLDPRVHLISLERYVSKYELRADPSHFFILRAGGVQPENHLLPLTYEQLDEQLLSGFPGFIASSGNESSR